MRGVEQHLFNAVFLGGGARLYPVEQASRLLLCGVWLDWSVLRNFKPLSGAGETTNLLCRSKSNRQNNDAPGRGGEASR
jgi:hypothetical protein